MKIQAILNFKNASIVEILQKHNITIKKLAEITGINYITLRSIVRFKHNCSEKTKLKLIKGLQEIEPDIKYNDVFPKEYKEAVNIFGTTKKETKDIPKELMIRMDDMREKILIESDIEQKLIEDDNKKMVLAIFSILSKKEEFILSKYFGINEDRNYTFKEIGNKYNVTSDNIRQIMIRAMRKIKHHHRHRLVINPKYKIVKDYFIN